jgi:hypothetical protein
MRPTGDTGNLSVATEVEGGRTRVVIDAVDRAGEFLDLPAMSGAAVGPGLGSETLAFQQIAPGRYVAEFDTAKPGSYLLLVNPGGGRAPIRTGVNVGVSNEFRDRDANLPLLEALAALAPPGGKPGVVLTAEAGVAFTGPESVAALTAINPFRRDLPPAKSMSPLWPQLVLAACVAFFADVFVRRVQLSFAWLAPLWRRLTSREAAPAAAHLERLRARKNAVREGIDSVAAAQRFDPASVSTEALAKATQSTDGRPATPAPRPPAPAPMPDADGAAPGYTSRLLKAKRDATQKRNE